MRGCGSTFDRAPTVTPGSSEPSEAVTFPRMAPVDWPNEGTEKRANTVKKSVFRTRAFAIGPPYFLRELSGPAVPSMVMRAAVFANVFRSGASRAHRGSARLRAIFRELLHAGRGRPSRRGTIRGRDALRFRSV